MTWIEVEFQGRVRRLPAVKAQGKLWFHWLGQTHAVELSDGTRRAGGVQNKTKPGLITAPMPGKITRVNAQVGETVKQGTALVVMEAMKMEYTLEADLDGIVKEVSAVTGAQVSLGDVLVRVEAP